MGVEPVTGASCSETTALETVRSVVGVDTQIAKPTTTTKAEPMAKTIALPVRTIVTSESEVQLSARDPAHPVCSA